MFFIYLSTIDDSLYEQRYDGSRPGAWWVTRHIVKNCKNWPGVKRIAGVVGKIEFQIIRNVPGISVELSPHFWVEEISLHYFRPWKRKEWPGVCDPTYVWHGEHPGQSGQYLSYQTSPFETALNSSAAWLTDTRLCSHNFNSIAWH